MNTKRRAYNRDDVELHNDNAGWYGPNYPAVNVKIYNYPTVWKVADTFGLTEKVARMALDDCQNGTIEMFWQEEQFSEYFKEIFGFRGVFYSAGRCGGWLIVTNLNEVNTWDAITLAKWRKFERLVKADVNYYTSWDYVSGEIKSSLDYWKQFDLENEENEDE